MIWLRQDTMAPSLREISNLVIYPVQTEALSHIIVARTILDSAKIPGKFHTNIGHFALNGQVVEFSAGNYDILIVSSKCDISWVNYDPVSGSALPGGAMIGGYQHGRQLYVARKGDNHFGHSYRYAAGYYDIYGMEGLVTFGKGVLTFTEMEILVVHG